MWLKYNGEEAKLMKEKSLRKTNKMKTKEKVFCQQRKTRYLPHRRQKPPLRDEPVAARVEDARVRRDAGPDRHAAEGEDARRVAARLARPRQWLPWLPRHLSGAVQ